MKIKQIFSTLIIFSLFLGGFSLGYADETLTQTGKSEEIGPKQIDVLMVLALPGSGKSEVRKYLASLSKEECKEKYGLGETVQIDDFPYVFMMRKASEEACMKDIEGIFFLSPTLSWKNPKDWGTLMQLVDEDYQDIITKKLPSADSASNWLFDRIDRAREKVGLTPVFAKLPVEIRKDLSLAMEKEAKKILDSKIEQILSYNEGKTIVIEFARGGAYGSKMPLPSPYGYKYALSQLSPSLLEKANILYIWVDPEESRRKNTVRANPQDPGSIMHHRVPLTVMYAEYGLDDVDYLLQSSKKPNTVTIEANGKMYYVPLGRFDNRIDKTTFLQKDHSSWSQVDVDVLTTSLNEAFSSFNKGKN